MGAGLVRLVLLACVAALCGGAAPAAHAHGDPSGHYLETDALYPSFASRPSQTVELELLGLLQAVQRDGYPIKVALVGGAQDVPDSPGMVRRPQRYARLLQSELEVARKLSAPLLVVTPHGFGIAGRALSEDRFGPVTRADARALIGPLRVSRRSDGDALAEAAMRLVRRVAQAGGHALPAHVPPARTIASGAGGGDDRGDSGAWPAWLPPAVFAAVMLLAWLYFQAQAAMARRGATSQPSADR